MKKLIAGLFLVQILVIGFWGLASQKWALGEAIKVDPDTGIVIKQDTPENAVTSYYELLSRKEYDKVRDLITPQSRELIDVKTMADMIKRTKMESALLEKVFPAAVDNDLAVVGYVRSATIEGKVFMVGLAVFKINNNRWEKIESAQELQLDELERVIKMAIKVEGDMLSAEKNDYGISGFTSKDQVAMITNQVTAMLENHKQSIVQLQEMKKQQQAAPQAPSTAPGSNEEPKNQETPAHP